MTEPLPTTAPWQHLPFMRERSIRGPHGSLNLASNDNTESPRILFLHGVLRQWPTFYPLLPTLAPKFHIHGLDFRGHGKSARTPGRYDVKDYVEDAISAVDVIGQPLHVYGHSLGAMVALATAAARPDLVRGIMLEDPPFSTMGEGLPVTPLGRYFAGVRDCIQGYPGASVEVLFEAFSSIIVGEHEDGAPIRVRDQRDAISRRFAAECLRLVDRTVLDSVVRGQWLRGYSLDDLATQVRCPVRCLQGDGSQGGMLTDSDVAIMKGRCGKRCSVRFFPGAGHQLHSTRTEDVLRELHALVTSS